MQVLDVIASEYRTNSESQASQGDAIMRLLLAVKVAFPDQEWQLKCCTSHVDAPMRREEDWKQHRRGPCASHFPIALGFRLRVRLLEALHSARCRTCLSPCCTDQPSPRDVSGSGEAVAAPRKRWRSCRWRSRGCSFSLWSCSGCRGSSELC